MRVELTPERYWLRACRFNFQSGAPIGDNEWLALTCDAASGPMLAKSVPRIPDGALSFEPNWDGFRSIIFRDGDEGIRF